MGRKRTKEIPQRTKKRDLQRAVYYKTLGTRPVSETTRNLPSEPELDEQATLGGTGYTPEEDTARTESEYKEIPQKKFSLSAFLKEHGIVTTIIGVILFVVAIVAAYDRLMNKIDNVGEDITIYKKYNDEFVKKLEKDLKDEIRHITERIDKYVSKRP